MKLSRIRSSLPQEIVFITAVAFLCFAAGCATPIGVNHVDRAVAYHSLTANAISAERASSFSARVLINSNLYREFEDNPPKALADLHSGLAPKGDEDRIFALAELSFLHAQNSGERSYYLAAAVYAYAFVLPGQRGMPPRGIDLRDSPRTETILDQDSGRGIVLMRLMADRIAFESRPEDGTIVHLQKRLELEENALLAAL